MLRRAHGPLAAIVIVAGGLLACATAPKPAEGDSAGNSYDPIFHCGYMPKFPPQQIVAAIDERARQDCSPGAAAYGRRGEFRAVLRGD